ncbi:hypothetical protein [Propionispora hippei]|uniref:LTXXQ motif family protein n=1 Tax=Propionispora hippei DSM 15287 TaxID=1123003 RepID=A0A1M6G5X7_9FIRM|nr:hypothetical protein [Propionispora hippei]SHJ05351.1 hypothetical protein SAMN02745170_01636 [Propionispora hippei DSM 15287]
MKISLMKKTIGGFLTGTILLSLGGLALAAPDTAAPPPDFGARRECPPPDFKDMRQQMTDTLTQLVSAGTITQDQADKLASFFQAKDDERRAEFEKVKAMSEADRRTYFQQKKGTRPDFIGDIKTAAGLSDDQAKAVADAMRPPRPAGPEKGVPGLKNKVALLVQDGTITQKQSDKLQRFFAAKAEERKAEFEKTKDMTPEERHAYFEQKAAGRPDMVKDLKKAAGLSDEQAKKVADTLRPPHGPLPGQPPCQPGDNPSPNQ